jgi:hypothetical protein
MVHEVTEIDLCINNVKWESRFAEAVVEAAYPSPEGQRAEGSTPHRTRQPCCSKSPLPYFSLFIVVAVLLLGSSAQERMV